MALFQIFFGLSALCLCVIMNCYFIYAVIKPVVNEDVGVIYGLAIIQNLELSITRSQAAMAAKPSNMVALGRSGS